ncbi:LysR family transcriptional regulator [Sedimentitalea nanhaiensis]|uniref:DNA-binding transcriptional regulator, LysR family n=1 Tax=Sedimentitalea nanhaiensis TaxID=999627 RepID=A0A1I7BVJ2_9RHOB|nr:LysR family transcriptional regulator [Sedimentitalea nanhaiensis]SFT91150.1 DNA-binding transcriptional regulator, LysR family [Sedimentitalea nanhaiensis]
MALLMRCPRPDANLAGSFVQAERDTAKSLTTQGDLCYWFEHAVLYKSLVNQPGFSQVDKLSVMHAFRRIVERGSFARAAEDLGVSPALLSREVKLLEESLGSTLLTRTTRSMSLTDAGRLYFDEAISILDAVTTIENRIRDGAGAVRGHLKVNASSSFGQTVIAPFLPGFLEAYPDLRLTLSLDDRVVDMVEGGFDVSIRIRAAMPDSALVARKIGTMRQRIFASPAYLEQAGVPQDPEDIRKHRVVGFLLADHLMTWTLTGPSDTRALDLDPKVRAGNSLVLRDLLIAGQGIGTLPDFVSDGPEARGDLVRVLPGWELPAPEIFAVTASRLGMDTKVTAFLDHLWTALRS